MKRIMPLVIAMFILLALAGCGNPNSGATQDEREELLRSHITPENHWNIVDEMVIEEYLISAIDGTNNKSGLAVFEPAENNEYKFQIATTSTKDQIIYDAALIGKNQYDLIWFNGAQTEYAEVIYTIDGQQQDALQFDTTYMNIIVNPSPAKDYSIQIIYHCADESTYTY